MQKRGDKRKVTNYKKISNVSLTLSLLCLITMIVFLGTQFFLLSVVMLIFTIAFYIYADIYFMANQMNGSLQTLYGHIGVLNRDKLNKELKIPFKRSKIKVVKVKDVNVK